jgi:beta-lactamase superfamily II metal-dependent hydrolase
MSKQFFQIELLHAAHGDCIWIEYGNANRTRRVLIDGGPIGQYKCLESKINTLKDGDRTFELVVLTHVDTDHVDGLVRLFANKKADWKFDTKDVWFNGWKHLESATLGGNQGEFFSALINARVGAAKWNQAFKGKTIVLPESGPLPRIKLADDFVVTLLSPTRDTLTRMKKAWQKDVKAFVPGDLEAAWAALAQQKKYLPNKTLLGSTPDMDALLEKQAAPDNSAANGSSIAFLAEFGGHSALLLGDAHADVIAASLTRLLAERGLKCLQVDAVKVAHHGSKANISDDLLALIDSPNFLISTNGAIFEHPDTEAIQRIIARSVHQPPTLHFNYRTPFTDKWDDPVLQDELGYEVVYNNSDVEPMKIRFESGGP